MKYSAQFLFIIFYFTSFLASSQITSSGNEIYEIPLTVLSDIQYPDNPQIGYKSILDGKFEHSKVAIQKIAEDRYLFTIYPSNSLSDTIIVRDLNLPEMIPSIPTYLTGNEFLLYIAIFNQEWNRVQVQFRGKNILTGVLGEEHKTLQRVDIANNCLGKGFWELACYSMENGEEKLYFQSWFQMPEELYDTLFFSRNKVSITQYNSILKNYPEIVQKEIPLELLRNTVSQVEIETENMNLALYPMTGERAMKAINILYPKMFTSIHEFLTDKTSFASFVNPGVYKKNIQRNTLLSKFSHLKKVMYSETVSTNIKKSKTSEFQFYFTDSINSITKLIIGGLELQKIPVLSNPQLNQGWQRPFGIANHAFSGSIEQINSVSTLQNPYYAFLTDENNIWLDSHAIGIDGILLYRDKFSLDEVHVLLMSYERYCFIGHYVFNIPLKEEE